MSENTEQYFYDGSYMIEFQCVHQISSFVKYETSQSQTKTSKFNKITVLLN
jgi:hypothetical protein